MAQTRDGAMKANAKKLGLSLTEYVARIDDGKRWCTGCKDWHPLTAFGGDASRYDGRAATCSAFRSERARARYVKKGRESKRGIFLVETRDGDKTQARNRVNHAVDVGAMPDPNTLQCAHCGRSRKESGVRHEYHHHRGYGADFQLDVIALCDTCHDKADRRTVMHCPHGHEYTPENTGRWQDGTRYCRECRRIRDRKRHDAAFWRARRAKRKAAA
jgi:hypothetical protein